MAESRLAAIARRVVGDRRRLINVVCLVLAIAASVLARGSAPGLMPLATELPYVALLFGWPLLAVTATGLPSLLGGWRTLLAGAAVTWLAATLGHALLPLGGYDLAASVDLYLYSALSGAVFMVTVGLLRDTDGKVWSYRISISLAVVFLMLIVLFGANRTDAVMRGPALSGNGSAPTPRVLYECEWQTSDTVCAVESEELDSGSHRYITVLDVTGGGLIIDLAGASTRRLDLLTPAAASLPGAPRPIIGRGSSAVRNLEFRGVSLPGTSHQTILVNGQAHLTVQGDGASMKDIPEVRFSAFVDPASASVTEATATICDGGRSVEPVFVGIDKVDGAIAGPIGSGRELRGDSRGVSLLVDGRVVWRLKMSLRSIGGSDSTIAWARPTATGGLVIAVNRLGWQESNNRGSSPSYPIFTILCIDP